MTIERTFAIIKPNSVAKNVIGAILQRFESTVLNVVGAKMLQLTREQAEGFYAEHKGKPFFDSLVDFMISGPILVQVLEGEDAVRRNREIMGATNPANALAGTLRPIMPTALPRTRYTVRIPLNLPRAKLLISLPMAKFAPVFANPCRTTEKKDLLQLLSQAALR